jgi:hypothetical protein
VRQRLSSPATFLARLFLIQGGRVLEIQETRVVASFPLTHGTSQAAGQHASRRTGDGCSARQTHVATRHRVSRPARRLNTGAGRRSPAGQRRGGGAMGLPPGHSRTGVIGCWRRASPSQRQPVPDSITFQFPYGRCERFPRPRANQRRARLRAGPRDVNSPPRRRCPSGP